MSSVDILTPPQKDSLEKGLKKILKPSQFSLKNNDRACYKRDSGFRTTIQSHFKVPLAYPTAIVWPETTQDISETIKLAHNHNLPVTTFGGGSGVCGGATPEPGALILDCKRLNKVLDINAENYKVTTQTGIFGATFENALNRQGLTLGHFPSSIHTATIGGYLAARSAGQLSSQYGKIEDMVTGIEFVDGLGRIHKLQNRELTHTCHPLDALVGSEGTLGIITKARFSVHELPAARKFVAFRFKELNHGINALRNIMQTGIKPSVLRLYDELDSYLMFSKSDKASPSAFQSVAQIIKSKTVGIAIRYHRVFQDMIASSLSGCLLIVVLEGESPLIKEQKKLITRLCTDNGATSLNESYSKNWYKHRYAVSFKATELFQQGAFVDTMEVATTWSQLHNLYQALTKALKKNCLVLAHISHAYSDGAAIYFTFVAPLKGSKTSLKTFDEIWHTALDTATKEGAVISHHHGIGRLKKPWISQSWQGAGEIYKQLKQEYDPHHVLNPNVLVAA